MLSSDPSAAFCLPITIRAPRWMLAFLSAFLLLTALWPSLSQTAAGLADAKTGCMRVTNTQTQKSSSSWAFVLSRQNLKTVIVITREAFF